MLSAHCLQDVGACRIVLDGVGFGHCSCFQDSGAAEHSHSANVIPDARQWRYFCWMLHEANQGSLESSQHCCLLYRQHQLNMSCSELRCVQTENESDWRSLQVNQESKSNLGEAIYTPKNSVFKKVGYKPYARW